MYKRQLNTIVRKAVKEYSLLFILRKLRLDLEPLDKAVVSDEKWLLFVIKQLLSNSLKYTKEGGIHIYMNDSRLVIEDSGIGIRSEDLPRIFEKGYTGYNGRVDPVSYTHLDIFSVIPKVESEDWFSIAESSDLFIHIFSLMRVC